MASKRAELYSLIAVIMAAVALALSLAPPSIVRASRMLQEAPADNAAPVMAAAVTALQRTFNYQGVLRLPDGSLAEGIFNMTFAIYDQVNGGTALHGETISGVAVRNGIFSVVLGAVEATPIGANVFAGTPRYLGIAVGTDPEMLPRQRIHPVPWALMAETLPADATTAGSLNVNGNLNVGSIFSNGALHANNPDNQSSVRLDFSTGVARIRVAGDGAGATSGLDIQTTGDRSLMRLLHNGTILVKGVPPIVIIRMPDVGDNAEVPVREPDGIDLGDYYCVATGWSAAYDINEDADDHTNMIWTYKNARNNWILRAHLASDSNDHESADVDVVCFHGNIASWDGDTTLNHPD